MAIQCQVCGNSDVRASRRKEPADADHARMGQTAYRCRSCRARFYSEIPAECSPKRRRRSRRRGWRSMLKQQKRIVINASLFLLVLGLFFVGLLYLANYHPDNQSSRGPGAGVAGQVDA